MRMLITAGLLAFMAACGGESSPTSPITPDRASSGQPRMYRVSGIVTEASGGLVRPLSNQHLTIYVREFDGLPQGLIYRTTRRDAETGPDGRYTVDVPKSTVFIHAFGKQQPCMASEAVARDSTVDVPTIAAGSSFTPLAAGSPLITGYVFESTPSGRKPLRGVTAYLDISQGAYTASTETDEMGHFYLCRVTAPVRLDVFGPDGYQPYQYGELLPGTGDVSFEFEFRR